MTVRRFPLPLVFPGSRRVARWAALHGLGLTPIVVYQMAKVGSSAVVDALLRSRLPTLHIHRMNPQHIAQLRDERLALGWRRSEPALHEIVGRQVYVNVITAQRPARFITLVRDPIARNLSSYFEHLDDIWSIRNAHQAVPFAELCAGFLPLYRHQEPLTWFDDELRPMLGIDVFARAFPSTGYAVMESGRRTLLVMKSELPDVAKRSALESYLGVKVASVGLANRTALTAKGLVYQQFIRSLRLPPDYVHEMLSARLTQHFYGDHERAEMAKRYLDKTNRPC